MCEFIALPLFLCSVSFGLTHCTSSFDQRQTGDLNVQIDLSNIQLIALLKGGKEEYVDYDYAYDYSEMTIKPQNGTTPKPVNVADPQTLGNGTTLLPGNATEPDTVVQPVISSISQNLTITNHITNIIDANLSSTEINGDAAAFPSSTTELNTSGIIFDVNNTNAINSAINQTVLSSSNSSTRSPESVTIETTTLSPDSPNNISAVETNHCRRGFVQNPQGKCEFKVHGTTNALRRIVKLAQKIKVGRGYKET